MNVTMQTLSNLTKKQIRYWCFRFNAESTNGTSAAGSPDGLKLHFEQLPWFPGWKNYGVTWDVDPKNSLDIKPLKESLVDAWNNEAIGLARDLPIVK